MNDVAAYVASLQTPGRRRAGRSSGATRRPARRSSSRAARAAAMSVTSRRPRRQCRPGADSRRSPALSPRELFQRIIVVPHRSTDPAYAHDAAHHARRHDLTGIKAGETDDAVRFYDTSSLPPILRTIPKKDIVGLEAHEQLGHAERLCVAADAAAAARHRLVPEVVRRRNARSR